MKRVESFSIPVTAEFIELVSRLNDIFDNDYKKVWFWLSTSNPHFGYLIPLKLIRTGRINKVMMFILNAEHENFMGDV